MHVRFLIVTPAVGAALILIPGWQPFISPFLGILAMQNNMIRSIAVWN